MCQLLLNQITRNTSLIGAYVPQCNSDGSFSSVQCHASTGYCWCVNVQTGEPASGVIRFGRQECASMSTSFLPPSPSPKLLSSPFSTLFGWVSVKYRIVGNFWGRKLSRELVKNTIFSKKNFVDCLLLPHQRMPHPQISQRKLSQIATKLRNLQKFSPSKVSRYTIACVKSCLPSLVPDFLSPSRLASPLLYPLSHCTHRLISSCFTDCSYQGKVYNIGQGFPASNSPTSCKQW